MSHQTIRDMPEYVGMYQNHPLRGPTATVSESLDVVKGLLVFIVHSQS